MFTLATGRVAKASPAELILEELRIIVLSFLSDYLERATEAKKVDKEVVEKEFKQQFVAHVTKKQQLIIDSTSDNCSKQVEQ